MSDIHTIKSGFDKYIIYVNDNINYYIPEIYKFPHYIAQSYIPVTHFAIIAREYKHDILHSLPYDLLLNLKSGDRLYVDYRLGYVRCV